MMNSVSPFLFSELPGHLHFHFQRIWKQFASLQNSRAEKIHIWTGRDWIIETDIKAFYVDVLIYHLLIIQSCLMLSSSIPGFVRRMLRHCAQAILYQYLGKQMKYLWRVASPRGLCQENSDSDSLFGAERTCAPLCTWFTQMLGSMPEWGLIIAAPSLSTSYSLSFLTCRLHEWPANSGPWQNSLISRWDRHAHWSRGACNQNQTWHYGE